MRLLDANALLALFFGEPAGPKVAELLEQGRCAMPASCLSEVVDRSIRRRGVPADAIATQLDLLTEGSFAVVDIDRRLALEAGRVRAEHYDRGTAPVSLADCQLIAAATGRDQIVTSDRALAEVAGRRGVEVIRLPSSSRPS